MRIDANLRDQRDLHQLARIQKDTYIPPNRLVFRIKIYH